MTEVPSATAAPESWKPWAALAAVVSIAFLLLLGPAINRRLHENDTWWMFPSVDYYTKGKPLSTTVGFIVGTEPQMLGGPYVKLFFVAVLRTLGPAAPPFLWALVAIHFINAALLFVLCRRLGWRLRESTLTALCFLVLYAQFESYLWPCNIQHLLITSFALLVVGLYLRTEALVAAGLPFRTAWIATLAANLFASFNRMSIVLLPVVILVHLLCHDDRETRYRRWLGLFATYLGYPMLVLVWNGDNQTGLALAVSSVPKIVSYALMVAAGAGALAAVPWLLRLAARDGRRTRIAAVGLGVLVLVAIIVKERRNLLLPLHLVTPAQGALSSLLMPLSAVMGVDSAEAMYPVPSQTGVVNVIVTVALIAGFARQVRDRRLLLPLLAWYLVPFPYLNMYDPTPSRYFTFIAPPVCMMAGWALAWLYDRGASVLTARWRIRGIVATCGLLGLLLPNILAIKLELLRGVLPNSFYVYDYARSVALARESRIGVPIGGVPMPYHERWSFCPVDPMKFENLRYMAGDLKVAPEEPEPADPFLEGVARGLAAISRDANTAQQELANAVKRRPHLANFILGRFSLEDGAFITDHSGLRSYANRSAAWWSSRDPKATHIQELMNRELDAYVLALFALAYLGSRAQDEDACSRWLYQIPHVDRDHLAVASLVESSALRNLTGMADFVAAFKNPEFYFDMPLWYPRMRNRFPSRFQVFLLKLTFDGVFNRAVDEKVERSKTKKERPPAGRYPVMPKD